MSRRVFNRKFVEKYYEFENDLAICKLCLQGSYIGLVTEDSIPFNVLNSENFKNILNPICVGLSQNVRKEITADLCQRLVSLKIDSTTRLSRNVFGISAQIIKNSEVQSRILGMVELKGAGSSSSRNLATEILNTLTKYNVNLNQIISITSDNGADMIKTTKIISHCSIFEEGCEGHDVEDGNEMYLQNINSFEDNNQIQLGDIQICRYVIKDVEIKNFLLSCRNITKFIKKAIERIPLKCNIIAFEPLQRTIVKFQEDQLHYGNFYAEWLNMENKTKKLLNNEILVSCLYLDPRFYHTLTPTQKHEATNTVTPLSKSSQLEAIEFSQDADEYLTEYLTKNFTSTSNEEIEVGAKIDNLHLSFPGVDTNVLHFWRNKQYSEPELYELSNICFAVPPTQVTIERAFSSLKLIMTDNRNRMKHETLENILLVKLNSTYLDQVIETLPLFEDDDD
ncbi:hypothetical protein CVS40_11832 [Lucilia cuprina]|nr:hypothetical protein CVS40_11832 [Lucilia cuprina]